MKELIKTLKSKTNNMTVGHTAMEQAAKELENLLLINEQLNAVIKLYSIELSKAKKGLQCLANIANAYDANELDDEARKYWGDESRPKDYDTELYSGRGGKNLLNLSDAIKAREIINSAM